MFDPIDPEMYEGRTRRQIALSIIAGQRFDDKYYDPNECWRRFGIDFAYLRDVERDMYKPEKPKLIADNGGSASKPRCSERPNLTVIDCKPG